VSKALEFGIRIIGCASTGNLAAALAAHAVKAGLSCYIFIPQNIEENKIIQMSVYNPKIVMVKGTYDDANRLAVQATEEYGLVVANVNIRPYYVEGSKTLAFEVCEQLNWQLPDHVIVPTASGALFCATVKGFKEFQKTGLVDDGRIKVSAAQPEGCSPIATAFKLGKDEITPVEYPNTIAKSLAIGNPGDGVYALKNVRETGGVAETATDQEIVEATKLLAKTEGIFAEPAGSITIAVLKKLVENGKISFDETVVCYITGGGLKTPEIISEIKASINIEPTLDSLRNVFKG
jgi:threonine synthase